MMSFRYRFFGAALAMTLPYDAFADDGARLVARTAPSHHSQSHAPPKPRMAVHAHSLLRDEIRTPNAYVDWRRGSQAHRLPRRGQAQHHPHSDHTIIVIWH